MNNGSELINYNIIKNIEIFFQTFIIEVSSLILGISSEKGIK